MSEALKKREQEVVRQLSALEAPEPPPELLSALREQIPEELEGCDGDQRAPSVARRWQLAAATLFVGVVGLLVVEQLRDRPLEPPAADSGVAEALRAPATPVSRTGPEPELDQAQDRAQAQDRLSSRGAAPDPEISARAEEPRRAEIAQGRASSPGSAPGQAGSRVPEPAAVATTREGDRTAPSPGAGEPSNAGREVAAPEDSAVDSQALEPSDPRSPVEEESLPVMEGVVAKKVPIPDPRPDESVRSEVQRRLEEPSVVGGQASAQSTYRASPASPPPTRLLSPVAELPNPPRPRATTGGTAEPNDQVFGDMFFESAGVNPFIDTEDDRLSTFGLDVDSGSYTVTRSYLERGELPPAAAIRVEEFVNYFSYDDPAPRRGDFALRAEGAPTPFGEGDRYAVLRFGIQGRTVSSEDRKPAVLTFVVDVSGSMAREDRLGLVKRSLYLLLDELTPRDRVGLVVYGERGRVLLEPSGDHGAIRDAIERLRPGGSTNAEEGLILGYRLARRHFAAGASNRVILCSDGVANVGRTGPDSILARIRSEAEKGIELTTVGFGMGNYNDLLMERLADDGDGRYAYVDSLAEARRLFVEDLTGTLQTIATDAKVQVDFDPAAVARYRLLGYENRDVADDRFRDDTVDAGEIGAGHRVTALYEIKLAPEARPGDRLATLRLRWRSEAGGEVEETGVSLRLRDLAPSWEEASRGLRLATLVAELAEILRQSYWARDADPAALLARAQRLSGEFAGDAAVAELVGLMGKAERLLAAAPGDDRR